MSLTDPVLLSREIISVDYPRLPRLQLLALLLVVSTRPCRLAYVPVSEDLLIKRQVSMGGSEFIEGVPHMKLAYIALLTKPPPIITLSPSL